jgi:hypothetical protein
MIGVIGAADTEARLKRLKEATAESAATGMHLLGTVAATTPKPPT